MTITPYPPYCESCKNQINHATVHPCIAFAIYGRYSALSEREIGCSLICEQKVTHCFHASCLDTLLRQKKARECPIHHTRIITAALLEKIPDYPITKVDLLATGVFIEMRKTLLQGMTDSYR